MEEGNIHRYIRYLEGGAVYEIVFNWSDDEQTYATDGRNIVNQFPADQDALLGTLPSYGTTILQLGDVPTDYKTVNNENCVQRRPVRKATSSLVLNI